jgi:hypothetical protein
MGLTGLPGLVNRRVDEHAHEEGGRRRHWQQRLHCVANEEKCAYSQNRRPLRSSEESLAGEPATEGNPRRLHAF